MRRYTQLRLKIIGDVIYKYKIFIVLNIFNFTSNLDCLSNLNLK
jgi:hypothetical protein